MTEDDFIAAVLADPDDDLLRLAYADWLEDHGDLRAEFVRVECQLRKRSSTHGDCTALQDRLHQLGRSCDAHWAALLSRIPRKWSIPSFGVLMSKPAAHRSAEWQLVGHSPDEFLLDPQQIYQFEFHSVLDLMDGDILQFGSSAMGMSQLRSLTMRCPNITDQAVMSLAGLTWLESFTLNGERLTGQALAVLQTMTNLTELDLEGFLSLTDRGLEYLLGLTRMRSLNLSSCGQITDDGLRCLDRMVDLEGLGLSSCANLTDRTLSRLIHFKKLRRLDLLSCWQITDRGLQYLHAMPQLEYLGLPRCGTFLSRQLGKLGVPSQPSQGNVRGQITARGLQRLRAALPKCEIWQGLEW